MANCTRECFRDCEAPRAADCSANCSASDFDCRAECHRNTTVCSVPRGPRNTQYFRLDPNEQTCYDLHSQYVSCVQGCHIQCIETLYSMQITTEILIEQWYVETCSTPLRHETLEMVGCITTCQDNCTRGCNETALAGASATTYALKDAYGHPMYDCFDNCTTWCTERCASESALTQAYMDACVPPVPFNCSASCFGEVCSPHTTFCGVYDAHGGLLSIDVNCTDTLNLTTAGPYPENATLASQLANANSWLSTLLGLNATYDVCYTDCDDANSTQLEWVLPDGSSAVAENCTTRCYLTSCIDSCLQNCTIAEAIAALPPCPIGPDCTGPLNCSYADTYQNCSAEKAFEPVPLNVR
eukprot:1666397-Prymnesium_polylepis.1